MHKKEISFRERCVRIRMPQKTESGRTCRLTSREWTADLSIPS